MSAALSGVRVLELAHERGAFADLAKLMEDVAPIDVYRPGQIEKTTIHQLAAASLANL